MTIRRLLATSAITLSLIASGAYADNNNVFITQVGGNSANIYQEGAGGGNFVGTSQPAPYTQNGNATLSADQNGSGNTLNTVGAGSQTNGSLGAYQTGNNNAIALDQVGTGTETANVYQGDNTSGNFAEYAYSNSNADSGFFNGAGLSSNYAVANVNQFGSGDQAGIYQYDNGLTTATSINNQATITQNADSTNSLAVIAQYNTADGNSNVQTGSLANVASITQGASDSNGQDALVVQNGSANSATVAQTGGGLAPNQTGSFDNVATVYQLNDGNYANVQQSGGDNAYVAQSGNFNNASVIQSGISALATVQQSGGFDVASVNQSSGTNTAGVYQSGVSDVAYVTQGAGTNGVTIHQH